MKKKTISIRERARWLKHAIEWLPLTNLPCHDSETKKWHEVRLGFKERFDCFLAGLETAVIGYVWELEGSGA